MEELAKPILAVIVGVAILVFVIGSIRHGKIFYLLPAGFWKGGALITRDKNPGLFWLAATAYITGALFIVILAVAVLLSVLS